MKTFKEREAAIVAARTHAEQIANNPRAVRDILGRITHTLLASTWNGPTCSYIVDILLVHGFKLAEPEKVTGPKGVHHDADHEGMIQRIHAILDAEGEEWDSETMSAVAEVFTDAGYKIRDPNDVEDDE